jgi:MFS family permease
VFILPAVGLWALLPVLASHRLGMGAGGYGLLLAALGLGAVLGATVMTRMRAAVSNNQMIVAASLTYAVVLAVLALVPVSAVSIVVLIPAGLAWMTVLSNLNAEIQLFLPRWVRARGLGTYQSVLFGSQAVGALVWGVVANRIGLVATFLITAAATAAGAATVRFWPLAETRHLNREPAIPWPQPQLTAEPDPFSGPVVVEVTYTVKPANEPAFLAAMPDLRRSRMRTGAVQWGIFRAGEVPDQMVEVYVVPTWDEHLRQHGGRMTGADVELDRQVKALSELPPQVAHLLPTDGVRQ